MNFGSPIKLEHSLKKFKYLFKDDISLESFEKTTHNSEKEIYVFEQSTKYLTVAEFKIFEEFSKTNFDKIKLIINEKEFKDYVQVPDFEIKIPRECFIQEEFINPEPFIPYDFTTTGNYFVYKESTYDDLTKLINCGIYYGYQVKSLNLTELIVEMEKNTKTKGF